MRAKDNPDAPSLSLRRGQSLRGFFETQGYELLHIVHEENEI